MKACYRNLVNYKYQLMEDYGVTVDIVPEGPIEFQFLSLLSGGLLTIRKGYAWDGPSGPSIDTRDFMRGSLIHDALYQLMRLGALNYQIHRRRADEILREACLQDGMSSIRAWYVYHAVRLFGESSARPRNEPEVEVICVP